MFLDTLQVIPVKPENDPPGLIFCLLRTGHLNFKFTFILQHGYNSHTAKRMFEAHLQAFHIYLKQEIDKLLIVVEVGPCTVTVAP